MTATDNLSPQQFHGSGRTAVDDDRRMTADEAEHYFWNVPRTEESPKGWRHSLLRTLTIAD
jgi:hypothetical protein